ncbi:MAG: helix-turn-helix transcriptional regulator [Candidatus Korarchaeota archaeon]|nr:helix-turn-helix transcriptional regulator [Candidatus Korarchaeota archaeon]NIU82798.1 transcriptional regulator [Candidatus Thorarchaeota archaeon]NIW13291.1 transcriptional regulator [Candidatus Thorarchaeota archaeon]NIW52147.1 transcriptional regulator [Candidatus Korarchaeota archaeon]
MSQSEEQREDVALCPCRNIFDILSRKWSFLIINQLGMHDTLRFNQLQKQLQDINPKTLSDTLSVLQREDLVTKKKYNEIPPRVEYSLTKDGQALRNAIIPLVKWAANRESKSYKFENLYQSDTDR